jgi:hypothetical protein
MDYEKPLTEADVKELIPLADSVRTLLTCENIQTRYDLETYGWQSLYDLVKSEYPVHWGLVDNPEESVRAAAHRVLPGYKAFINP